jgi:RNA polymerase sigma factor (TIGR02999 family)
MLILILVARFRCFGLILNMMDKPSSNDLTQLLLDLRDGNKEALDKLMPVVYGELRRLARGYLQNERRDHSLQATALVNEAYLRLIGNRQMNWQSRAHFFGVAAQQMRRILVDHARTHKAAKRGGSACKVSLSQARNAAAQPAFEVVALDVALDELAQLDPQQSRLVELRFFGGLSIEETAEVLNLSPATVKRHWATARAWLYQRVSEV